MGTPITSADKVTQKEPSIMGSIPNVPLEGDHLVPMINSTMPSLAMIGDPSLKMNMMMSARAAIAKSATRARDHWTSVSLRRIILPASSLAQCGKHVRTNLSFPGLSLS